MRERQNVVEARAALLVPGRPEPVGDHGRPVDLVQQAFPFEGPSRTRVVRPRKARQRLQQRGLDRRTGRAAAERERRQQVVVQPACNTALVALVAVEPRLRQRPELPLDLVDVEGADAPQPLQQRHGALKLGQGRPRGQRTADVRERPRRAGQGGVGLRCAEAHALERQHQHRIAREAPQRGVEGSVSLGVRGAEHALGKEERVAADASDLELLLEHRAQQGLGVHQRPAAETRGRLVGVLRKLDFAEHLVPQTPERGPPGLARFPDPNRAQHRHRIQTRRRDVGRHVSVPRQIAEPVPQGPEAVRGVLRPLVPQREGEPLPGRGEPCDGIMEVRELSPVAAEEAWQEARRVRRARPHDRLPARRRRASSGNHDLTVTDPQAAAVAAEGLQTVAVAVERRQGARRVLEKRERRRVERREAKVQAGGVRPRRHAGEQARRKLARLDRRGGGALHVAEQQPDPEVRGQRKLDGEGRNLDPECSPAVQQFRKVIDTQALVSEAGADRRAPALAAPGSRIDPVPSVDRRSKFESQEIEERSDFVAAGGILHRGEAEAPPVAGLHPCGLHGAQVVQVGDQRRPRTRLRPAPVELPDQLTNEARPPIGPRIQARRTPDPVVRSRHRQLEPMLRLRPDGLGARQQAQDHDERDRATCHGTLSHRRAS